MVLTDADIEAAKKRKAATMLEQEPLTNNGQSDGPATTSSKAPAFAVTDASHASAANASQAPAPAPAAKTLIAEPTFLLDISQTTQVTSMKNDTLQALATAMGVHEEGDAKPIMITKIVRFMGTCTSMTFDPANALFEFVDLKKQDFQPPTAQPQA